MRTLFIQKYVMYNGLRITNQVNILQGKNSKDDKFRVVELLAKPDLEKMTIFGRSKSTFSVNICKVLGCIFACQKELTLKKHTQRRKQTQVIIYSGLLRENRDTHKTRMTQIIFVSSS